MEGSRFCNGSRPCRNVGHVGAMRSERPWGAPVRIRECDVASDTRKAC